jgi:hypothetical protein
MIASDPVPYLFNSDLPPSLFLGFILTPGRPPAPFGSLVLHRGHPRGRTATALCLAAREPFHHQNRRIYVFKFLA